MVKVKHILTFLFLLCFLMPANSQFEVRIDSIKRILQDQGIEEKAYSLFELAKLHYANRDAQNSFQNASEALQIADSLDLTDLKADANLLLGRISIVTRRRDDAISYLEKSLKYRRELEDSLELAQNLNFLAEQISSTNPQRAIELSQESFFIAQQLERDELKAKSSAIIGLSNYYVSNYREALDAWETALEIYENLDIKQEVGVMLTNIGVIYKNWGDYQQATDYYQRNLDLQQEIGDTLQIAKALSNMGNIFYYVGVDYVRALDYYQQSLMLFEAMDNPFQIANTLNNIGLVYNELNNPDEAILNFEKALEQFRNLNYKPGIASVQNHMGNIYLERGNLQDALNYSMQALKINEEIGNRKETASNLRDIGRVYLKWERYERALDYFNRSLKISEELELKKEVYEIYRNISEVYEKQEKLASALEYFKTYNALKDSSITEEYLKQISELETKYETERVEGELEVQRLKNAEQEAESAAKDAELRRQRVLLISVIIGLFVVALFSLLFYRQFREKKRANILLEEQNIEIKQQRDQILQQKQEITDSIHYASRIQNAILPPDRILAQNLSEHFVLYLPRDIVSGDFYWMTEMEGKIVVVAADCTGHGVPGAFMSMLGVSFLHEIVNKNKVIQANEILNELRRNVVESLHQTGKEGEAQDGMDISLLVIDRQNMMAEYAGAYNSLYLIRDDQFKEIKADKMPIGISFNKSRKFANNRFELKKDDCLYLFSDGYMDQFGGEKGKKFMAGKFKELIRTIHSQPFEEQFNQLLYRFNKWRGNIEQIDDVLIIGLKI